MFTFILDIWPIEPHGTFISSTIVNDEWPRKNNIFVCIDHESKHTSLKCNHFSTLIRLIIAQVPGQVDTMSPYPNTKSYKSSGNFPLFQRYTSNHLVMVETRGKHPEAEVFLSYSGV